MKAKRPAVTVGIHARLGRVRSLLACIATVALPILGHAGGPPRFGESAPPDLGGPIDLVDQAGHAFHLSQLSGRSTLVLFGLTAQEKADLVAFMRSLTGAPMVVVVPRLPAS